jgi:hypothetical protein
MEYSKLTYSDWLFTIIYIRLSKKPTSAKELQLLLGKKYYEPVWTMLHKIRCIMSKFELNINESSTSEYVRTILPFRTDKHQTINLLLRNKKIEGQFYRIDICDVRSINKFIPKRNSKDCVSRSVTVNKSDILKCEKVARAELSYWDKIFISNLESNIRGVYHHISDKFIQNYLSEFTFQTNLNMKKGDFLKEIMSKCLTNNWYD